MDTIQEKINLLIDNLRRLEKHSVSISMDFQELHTEIIKLQDELERLRRQPFKVEDAVVPTVQVIIPEEILEEENIVPIVQAVEESVTEVAIQQEKPVDVPPYVTINQTNITQERLIDKYVSKSKKTEKTDWEKFIGENLINKIGIVIVLLGVGMGAKFAIENDLISETGRILLGYLFGGILIAIGLKLKKKYLNFSAVIFGGGMAIMYFITYFAYDFYHLIAQMVAFAMMLCFTIFTVWAAIRYDKAVIAHFGLVGAYAVPFLLSNGSGAAVVLFSYVFIINLGILSLALAKRWRSLFVSSFVFTWAIYISWYLMSPTLQVSLVFGFIFCLLFYAIILAFRRKDDFKTSGKEDVLFVLLNSCLFYVAGMNILGEDLKVQHFQGLYTLGHAMIQFVVAFFVYRKETENSSFYQFIVALGLVYVGIAVPVQLEGEWIVLMWAGIGAGLIYVGQRFRLALYTILGYPFMMLSGISIAISLLNVEFLSVDTANMTSFFNLNFFVNLVVFILFGWVSNLQKREKEPFILAAYTSLRDLVNVLVPVFFFVLGFLIVKYEIDIYFLQKAAAVENKVGEDYDYRFVQVFDTLKTYWTLIYGLFYLTVIGYLNQNRWNKMVISQVNVILLSIAVILFCSKGLMLIDDFRNYYFSSEVKAFELSRWVLVIPYLGYVIFTGALLVLYRYFTTIFKDQMKGIMIEWLFHIVILIVSSFEFNFCLGRLGVHRPFAAISILWGAYALAIVIYGIYKRSKTNRIFGIALLALTVGKLFFVDIVHLSAIWKTVIFIGLGVVLLIVSFLYNKYTKQIDNVSGEMNEEEGK